MMSAGSAPESDKSGDSPSGSLVPETIGASFGLIVFGIVVAGVGLALVTFVQIGGVTFRGFYVPIGVGALLVISGLLGIVRGIFRPILRPRRTPSRRH
jgi:hypothetical protein